MEKKYQIFISSTYEDLKKAREKVQDAVMSMYHFPVGMELFGAADEEQWEIIKETIDSSDYYVLIIAQRYGSIIADGPDAGMSYTEREFRYAKEKGIPILVFIMNDDVPVMPAYVDAEPEKAEKLKKFKDEAKTGRTVVWWSNEDELATKVTASLYKEFNRKKRPGWIRGDSVDIEKSLDEIVTLNIRIRKLEEENRLLRSQNIERKPQLAVGINCEGEWKLEGGNIPRPEYIQAEYLPLSIKDACGLCSVEEIEEYNKGLPSEEVVQEYIDSLHMFKYKTEAYVNFEFYVENSGSCKANDINVSIKFPEELLVLERDDIEEITEPEAPSKPKNPVEEALKRKTFGAALEYMESLQYTSSLPMPSLYPALRSFHANYHRRVENNCIKLEIDDLLHTYLIDYDQFAVVPTQKGKFQIKCTIMCEEFLEPVEQIIDVKVV